LGLSGTATELAEAGVAVTVAVAGTAFAEVGTGAPREGPRVSAESLAGRAAFVAGAADSLPEVLGLISAFSLGWIPASEIETGGELDAGFCARTVCGANPK
jgi:hypothetical protein